MRPTSAPPHPDAHTALHDAVPPRTSLPFPERTLTLHLPYTYLTLTLRTNRQSTPRRDTDAISSTLFAAVAAFAWPEAGGAASGMQRLVCAYGLAFFAVDMFPTLLTGDALAIVHHVIAIGGYAKVLFSPASESQVKKGGTIQPFIGGVAVGPTLQRKRLLTFSVATLHRTFTLSYE